MFSQRTKEKAKYWAAKLECPWCNRDLIPIPADRRPWTWAGFTGYWIITGANNSAWTAGSTLLSLGLSVGQAMGVIVGGSFIIAMVAVVAGWMGSYDHLGFTVMSRDSWGMTGGFWPVLNRIVTTCIWMGVQTYWGVQAVKIILGAVIGPRYAYMTNTLPLSANVDTCSLVSFFIFLVVFAPFLMIPPEKLQLPLKIAFVMITCNIFRMLIWSVRTAHGAGDLISTGSTESDWTRYAKTPNASLFGQGIACPLIIIITALCGVIITSATNQIYGEYFWNPFELLLHIQKVSLTPATRAGTFFAGLTFLASQMALCIVLNAISTGMDMAALCPRWINIRRGYYILTVIAVAICPWNFVNNVTTGVTGILIFDYFLVRRGQLHVGDLYLAGEKSAYWYTGGVNWRAVVAWVMGVWPLLRGFVRRVQQTANGGGWDHVYDLSYFFGFFVSGITHWGLHTLFPTARQTGSSPFEMELHGPAGGLGNGDIERRVAEGVDSERTARGPSHSRTPSQDRKKKKKKKKKKSKSKSKNKNKNKSKNKRKKKSKSKNRNKEKKNKREENNKKKNTTKKSDRKVNMGIILQRAEQYASLAARELVPRRTCYRSRYGYRSSYRCRSAFSSWGRWVLAGILIFVGLVLLLVLLCCSRRRKRRNATRMATQPATTYTPQNHNNTNNNGYTGAPANNTQYAPPAGAPPTYGNGENYGYYNAGNVQQPGNAYVK
ncbi:permease for cytosine/purines, uracil, thiamine, allantoin-domain-containing protein [Amylocarpus encephaloides]|uniref:Permease for cytosine/purines, uracil, thiamine, allantoin-domain-containing protein n=1 Tax=Amylocarpus encephaloides TaxID=45428 RepID=A0A9P7YSS0_9HELO|nr:permease for cytosine/purines, uracil, thiamine, allantoin-domain-containing protein [Amylocarpus encephaloides]